MRNKLLNYFYFQGQFGNSFQIVLFFPTQRYWNIPLCPSFLPFLFFFFKETFSYQKIFGKFSGNKTILPMLFATSQETSLFSLEICFFGFYKNTTRLVLYNREGNRRLEVKFWLQWTHRPLGCQMLCRFQRHNMENLMGRGKDKEIGESEEELLVNNHKWLYYSS